jgi:hypothetical protein
VWTAGHPILNRKFRIEFCLPNGDGWLGNGWQWGTDNFGQYRRLCRSFNAHTQKGNFDYYMCSNKCRIY